MTDKSKLYPDRDKDLNDIEKHIDDIDIKKLDENNPSENAMRFNIIKKNPPKPGYMEVEYFKAKDENGQEVCVTESRDKTGKLKRILTDPIMAIDLNILISHNIAACPNNVIPMLIDKSVQTALEEKEVFKAEKRRKDFNWWWIVFLLIPIPAVLFWIFALM